MTEENYAITYTTTDDMIYRAAISPPEQLVLPKAPVTPGLRPGYDLATTDFFSRNRGQIVQRKHDWSHRSWVIARAKYVVTKSIVMFKTSNLRFQIVSGRR